MYDRSWTLGCCCAAQLRCQKLVFALLHLALALPGPQVQLHCMTAVRLPTGPGWRRCHT